MTSLAMKKILFATDFSACAARAEEYALFLARTCGAQLCIVHVLEFQPGMDPNFVVNSLYLEQLRKETDSRLQDLVAGAKRDGIVAEGQHVLGIPSQRVNEQARHADVDLIVVGTHGATGLEHILLGSTAERVVKGAPCPVLTVRGPRERGRTERPPAPAESPRITHLLVALDFSDCSMDAFEYAVQMAAQFGSKVTLLHVIEPVSYGLDFTLTHTADIHKRREQVEARLIELAGLVSARGLVAEHRIRGGLPADGVLDTATEQKCDLIVMGTHGRRGVSHLLSGSVAEAVLRRADCPVLTVKSPKFAPGHRRR